MYLKTNTILNLQEESDFGLRQYRHLFTWPCQNSQHRSKDDIRFPTNVVGNASDALKLIEKTGNECKWIFESNVFHDWYCDRLQTAGLILANSLKLLFNNSSTTVPRDSTGVTIEIRSNWNKTFYESESYKSETWRKKLKNSRTDFRQAKHIAINMIEETDVNGK